MVSNPVGASEFFLGFICNSCLIKLLHDCEDHFHLYNASTEIIVMRQSADSQTDKFQPH